MIAESFTPAFQLIPFKDRGRTIQEAMSHLIAPPAILLSLASAASIYLISTKKTTTDKNSYSSLPTTSTTSSYSTVGAYQSRKVLKRDVEIETDIFYPRLRVQKLLTISVFILLEIELLGEIGYNIIEGLSSGIDEMRSLLIGDGLMALFTVSLTIL